MPDTIDQSELAESPALEHPSGTGPQGRRGPVRTTSRASSTLRRVLAPWIRLLRRGCSLLRQACDRSLTGLIDLPAPIRRPLRAVARVVGRTCAGLTTWPRTPARWVTDGRWQIVIVGSEATSRELASLFFDNPQLLELEPVPTWQLRKSVRSWLDDGVDLVVYERPGLCHPHRFDAPIRFEVPSWIDQRLPLPPDRSGLISGKKRKSRRLRVKHCLERGYQTRFSRDAAEFERFYDSIYRPFIDTRHGPLTMPTPKHDLRRAFLAGGLVCIELDGQTVAASVGYVEGDTYFNSDGGVSVADPSHNSRGVGVFLDWAAMQRAFDEGTIEVNLGGTRPWHSNGVFRYKSQWGADVVPRARLDTDWTFLADDLPGGLRARINEIGFMTVQRDGCFAIHVATAVTGDEYEDDEAAIAQHVTQAIRRGLDGVTIVVPRDNQPRRRTTPTNLSNTSRKSRRSSARNDSKATNT